MFHLETLLLILSSNVGTLHAGYYSMMLFQDTADLEQNKILDLLCLRKTQAAHQYTGSPMPRLRGVSFVNEIRFNFSKTVHFLLHVQ